MEDYYGIKSRRAREYIRSLPFKKKIPWKAMFPKTNDLALDLLERLLAFNPVKRITVEEALKHPYLEPYHDPDDEPTADPIPEEFFDFDKNKDQLSKEQLKSKSSTELKQITKADNAQCSSTRRSCDNPQKPRRTTAPRSIADLYGCIVIWELDGREADRRHELTKYQTCCIVRRRGGKDRKKRIAELDRSHLHPPSL